MVGSSCKANLDQIEGVNNIYIYIYIAMKLPKLLPTPHFKDIAELKKPLGYGSDGPTTFNICGNKM
jgi:hypothetical protein